MMRQSIAEFEDFLKEYRRHCNVEAMEYWADSIFVANWGNRTNSTQEKRFRYGLFIWIVLCVLRIVSVASSRKLVCRSPKNKGSADIAFRMISESPHTETLEPIVQSSKIIWGDEHYEIYEETGLKLKLSSVSTLVALKALSRSIRSFCKTQQIIRRMSPTTFSCEIKDFTPRMAEILFRHEIEREILNIQVHTHRNIFVTYELSPELKAFVLWGRATNKRVIHIMHGQRLPTYQVTRATDLVLFSKVDEPWFRERVPEHVKLWTIGHPRLESIRKEIGAPRRWVPGKKPRITYFSQPAEGDYSPSLRKADWAILRGLKGLAEVRFRLHPRECRERAMDDLESIGIDFAEISDAGLHDDLRWSDAVVSSWSSVSMEAAACGRGIFWACSTPVKYEAAEELRAAGIGTLVSSPDDWSQHLDAWNSSGWEAPTLVSDQALKKLGMIGDMDKSFIERLGISVEKIS